MEEVSIFDFDSVFSILTHIQIFCAKIVNIYQDIECHCCIAVFGLLCTSANPFVIFGKISGIKVCETQLENAQSLGNV